MRCSYRGHAYTFLESFLANAKSGINVICRTFIIQRYLSAIILYILQQGFREVIHFFKARLLKYQVYLTILTYLLDESFHLIAGMQGLEYLAIIQQATILILNDRLEA